MMILSRWLHIYLSMASFGILFFFAVTGLTLNHAEWFVKQQQTTQLRAAMDKKYLGKEVAKLEIVEGAGHFVEMEKPEALASLVTRFLTQA